MIIFLDGRTDGQTDRQMTGLCQ